MAIEQKPWTVFSEIPGLPTYYISKQGTVKQFGCSFMDRDNNTVATAVTEREVEPYSNVDGQLLIDLQLEGMQVTCFLCELVGATFHVDGWLEGSHVLYKDGNKSNVSTDNLQWVFPEDVFNAQNN